MQTGNPHRDKVQPNPASLIRAGDATQKLEEKIVGYKSHFVKSVVRLAVVEGMPSHALSMIARVEPSEERFRGVAEAIEAAIKEQRENRC
jgi:hypothetical protein